MNFDFAPEQRELQQQLRRVLNETCTREVIRRTVDDHEPMARDLWRQLGTLGYLGVAVPERYGGAGLGYLELCLVAEEIGRSIAPLPMSSSIYQVAEVLLAAGSEVQKRAHLPGLAAGEVIGCAALQPGKGARGRPEGALRFDGSTLNGCARSVLDGAVADIAVLAVADHDREGQHCLVLVDLRQPGIERTTVESIDLTRRRADIVFTNARAEAISGVQTGARIAQAAVDRACVMLAFEQIGGAAQCLEMARDYALERNAFGRPIGSYQAIKHKLVDVYARNRLATAHAYFAAWALSTGSDQLQLSAGCARVMAGEAFCFAAQENIQVHGGIGFTWEHDCHLFYRRARAMVLDHGSLHEWRERIASALISQSVTAEV